MTQKDRQLLLKDLCTRLPYGVKICVGGYICTLLDINEMGDKTFHTAGFNKPNGDYDFCTISEVKPYLRPMSSMTEEEYEYYNACAGYGTYEEVMELRLEFLCEYHFDYRGLIEKGLALEAPEGMYLH